MESEDLQQLLDQLTGSQAKHAQRLAELDSQEKLLRTVIAASPAATDRPILVEVLKTLTVIDAAERMQADAVDRLKRFVAESRGE